MAATAYASAMDHDAAWKRLFGLPILVEHLLPVVIHSSSNRWTAAGGAAGVELSADGEVPMLLNPYLLLDARRLTREHLPRHNIVAALFDLDAARTESELAGHMRELSSWLPAALAPEAADAVLTALFDWLSTAAWRIVPDSDTAELMSGLRRELRKPEERMTLLAERMEEWKADWLRQGMQQGVELGLEQGLEQGIEHGLAAERELLHRLAERKFDRASADELAGRLTAVKDADYFAQVGGWIIDCATGAELLDRMRLNRRLK